VYQRVREQMRSGEYEAVKHIIKMAMKAGQPTAIVCRLTAERDYKFSSARHEVMSPQRHPMTALERESVSLRNGAFWKLCDPWRGLASWLKHEQGLEWDLSFILMGRDSIFDTPVEATYADLLVSWPPFTASEAGRVKGELMQFWEDCCIRKTVQVSEGRSRWKALIKNCFSAGQPAAILQTLYSGPDFRLVAQDKLSTQDPQLICVHGARCWLSNARLPKDAVEDGAYWVLERKYREMVEWIADERLNWYLVFDVEIDPHNKKSLAAAQAKQMRQIFERHMDEETQSITLGNSERFLLAAAALEPVPLKYRLSKWAYLVVTDYPIKKLGSVQL
jgi:hypothetical protein